MVKEALNHPAVQIPVGTALAVNPWWLSYISEVAPLVSLAAATLGAVYVALQIMHLLKHWNIPRK